MTRGTRALVTVLAVASIGAACGLRPTQTPIPTARYVAGEGESPDDLVVMLPGFGDGPRRFEREGLIDSLQQLDTGVEVVVVDAHYGYYARRELPDRLVQDILIPARARGQRVWLVGVSLGGFGALLTAKKHPDLVDGLVLLSPYLGKNDVQMDIARAGGLSRWTPPPGAHDYSTDLWRWLKGYTQGASRPPLVIGYARGERLAWGVEQLAPALGPDLVVRAEGHHDWATWRRLWPQLLSRVQAQGWLISRP